MKTKKIFKTLCTKLEYKDAGIAIQLAGEVNLTVSSFIKHLIEKEAEREKSPGLNFHEGSKLDSLLVKYTRNELENVLVENESLKEKNIEQKKEIDWLNSQKLRNEISLRDTIGIIKHKKDIEKIVEAYDNEKMILKTKNNDILLALYEAIDGADNDIIQAGGKVDEVYYGTSGYVHLNRYTALVKILKDVYNKFEDMY